MCFFELVFSFFGFLLLGGEVLSFFLGHLFGVSSLIRLLIKKKKKKIIKPNSHKKTQKTMNEWVMRQWSRILILLSRLDYSHLSSGL